MNISKRLSHLMAPSRGHLQLGALPFLLVAFFGLMGADGCQSTDVLETPVPADNGDQAYDRASRDAAEARANQMADAQAYKLRKDAETASISAQNQATNLLDQQESNIAVANITKDQALGVEKLRQDGARDVAEISEGGVLDKFTEALDTRGAAAVLEHTFKDTSADKARLLETQIRNKTTDARLNMEAESNSIIAQAQASAINDKNRREMYATQPAEWIERLKEARQMVVDETSFSDNNGILQRLQDAKDAASKAESGSDKPFPDRQAREAKVAEYDRAISDFEAQIAKGKSLATRSNDRDLKGRAHSENPMEPAGLERNLIEQATEIASARRTAERLVAAAVSSGLVPTPTEDPVAGSPPAVKAADVPAGAAAADGSKNLCIESGKIYMGGNKSCPDGFVGKSGDLITLLQAPNKKMEQLANQSININLDLNEAKATLINDLDAFVKKYNDNLDSAVTGEGPAANDWQRIAAAAKLATSKWKDALIKDIDSRNSVTDLNSLLQGEADKNPITNDSLSTELPRGHYAAIPSGNTSTLLALNAAEQILKGASLQQTSSSDFDTGIKFSSAVKSNGRNGSGTPTEFLPPVLGAPCIEGEAC